MCLVVKNQNADLREWVSYHRMLGAGKFYIFDGAGDTDPASAVLADFIKKGIVEYVDSSGRPKNQRNKYQRCINEHKHKHQWIAFIDADEFIVLDDPTATIPDMLSKYTAHAGVVLNWLVFGSSGHKKRPRGGISNYYMCAPPEYRVNHYVKSIVNTDHVGRQSSVNPHFFRYKNGSYSVTADGTQVQKPGAFQRPPVYTGWHINHYMIKSLEDYKAKMARGGATTPKPKNMSWFHDIDAHSTVICPPLVPGSFELPASQL